MISTPTSSTSDYYSGSDFEYDDDEDIVKATSQHYNHKISSSISSTFKLQQSIRLLQLVKENYLSDEIFIRANSILHKYLLLSTSNHHIDESILIACLSLTTKLNEHSNKHLFNTDTLILNEQLICDTLDWDIDLITPINHVEAILLHLTDSLIKDRLRNLTYELIVLCLTDIRCIDLSVLSIGISCLLMSSEMLNCCEIIPKEIFEIKQDNSLLETSLMYIRQILLIQQ